MSANLIGSRFITRFELTAANNTLIYSASDAIQEELDMPVGFYRWSSDSGGDGTKEDPWDFARQFEIAWFAASSEVIGVMTLWVDQSTGDAIGKAPGRVRYVTNSDPFKFLFSAPSSTLDPRILGFDPASVEADAPGGLLISDWVHRYGWYPQIDYEELITDRSMRSYVEMTTGGYLHGLKWGLDKLFSVSFYARSPGLVRIDAGLVASVMASIYATVGDENIAYEAWVLDLIDDITKHWWFYPLSDEFMPSDALGPYRFAPGDIWQRPLSGVTSIAFKAGELWNVGIEGREARE